MQEIQPLSDSLKTATSNTPPLPPDPPRRTNGAPAHRPENRTHFVGIIPFLEMPDSRYINDGFQVLLELGAVEAVWK